MANQTIFKTQFEIKQQKERDAARYEKIKPLRSKLADIDLKPKRGQVNFTGRLIGEKAQALSEKDIAMLVAWGDISTGWDCKKLDDGRFIGHYNRRS